MCVCVCVCVWIEDTRYPVFSVEHRVCVASLASSDDDKELGVGRLDATQEDSLLEKLLRV